MPLIDELNTTCNVIMNINDIGIFMTSKDSITFLFEIGDIETKAILKAAAKAHQALGEVKVVAANIPNQYILSSKLFFSYEKNNLRSDTCSTQKGVCLTKKHLTT